MLLRRSPCTGRMMHATAPPPWCVKPVNWTKPTRHPQCDRRTATAPMRPCAWCGTPRIAYCPLRTNFALRPISTPGSNTSSKVGTSLRKIIPKSSPRLLTASLPRSTTLAGRSRSKDAVLMAYASQSCVGILCAALRGDDRAQSDTCAGFTASCMSR